jgi:hypothetical protein
MITRQLLIKEQMIEEEVATQTEGVLRRLDRRLLGFSLHVGGALIHLLLVVGLVVLIINLLSGRRSAV